MTVVFNVFDPKLKTLRKVAAYKRDGRVVLQELADTSDPFAGTPEQLETRRRFSAAAQEAYGRSGLVDGLPPAAAAVKKRTATGVYAPRRDRQARQRELRAGIPPEYLRAAERMMETGLVVELAEPTLPLFEPVRGPTIREIPAATFRTPRLLQPR